MVRHCAHIREQANLISEQRRSVLYEFYVADSLVFYTSSYTVGFQNSAGIQYLDRKTDKWLDPVVDGEAMYLNVGDVMTRISNGEDIRSHTLPGLFVLKPPIAQLLDYRSHLFSSSTFPPWPLHSPASFRRDNPRLMLTYNSRSLSGRNAPSYNS